jgi:hypothetical protein
MRAVAGRTPSFNFSRLALHKAQREDKPSTPEKPERTEDEAYNEAMKKLAEAFLETAPGREIKEKAKEQGDAFISTLPGKVITGTAIAGALATLAASEKRSNQPPGDSARQDQTRPKAETDL